MCVCVCVCVCVCLMFTSLKLKNNTVDSPVEGTVSGEGINVEIAS